MQEDVLDFHFTTEDVKVVVKITKVGKVADINEVYLEFMKHLGPKLIIFLTLNSITILAYRCTPEIV